jgi:hypothetical protein
MRKRIVGQMPIDIPAKSAGTWIDLEQIATVEVTSEDPGFPIESVFNAIGPGWRALEKGEQRIRIIFDQPAIIKRIRLRFDEAEVERTQEFSLSWSSAEGDPLHEIVRQQWNFSPAGSNSEVEDYQVDLHGVSALQLVINPDLGGRAAPATLREWRIA